MSLVAPYWCSETFSADGASASWTPVWQTDQDILEDAYEKGTNLAYIEDRKSVVNVKERTMRNCYEFSPHCNQTPDSLRRVIRGLWFYVNSSGSAVPLSEKAGLQIENWFQSIQYGEPKEGSPFTAELDVDIILDNARGAESATYRVVATKEKESDKKTSDGKKLRGNSDQMKVNGFSINMYPKSSSILKIGSVTLQRGLKPPKKHVEEDWSKLEEDHLILIVHGVGQYYFANTNDSFSRCVIALRNNLMDQRCALDVEDGNYARSKLSSDKNASSDQKADNNPNPNNHKRIDCLGVDWFKEIHDDADVALKSYLEKVTLPSIASVRKVAHDVAMDVLLYVTPEFKEKILKVVVEKINLIYAQYCELNPNFVKNGGMCSIVGHSLGTVIVYDILASQSDIKLPSHLKLSFEPTAFFSLGSPLGMFLTVRNSASRLHNIEVSRSGRSDEEEARNDDVFNSSYSFPTCKQFFNVFNKNDPAAYRLEPMVDDSLQELEPMLVPHHDGGLRAQYKLKSVATTISQTWQALSTFSSPSEWFRGSSSSDGKQSRASDENNVTPSRRFLRDNTSDKHSLSEFAILQNESAAKRLESICPSGSLSHVSINLGRRFDYLLQESAFEAANEYVSSLTSHTSYFDQKDVARFIASMLQ